MVYNGTGGALGVGDRLIRTPRGQKPTISVDFFVDTQPQPQLKAATEKIEMWWRKNDE
ncbi:hypothetical protein BRCON_2309 [Candidatus Sumerlaea chitinivorans]|uniref:Uncharacterized protein n=1 Tax=Sumerlaea chitinivorans TaxID=2250252 RepID=A0A2Z4Y7U4_SUMC1|nr:hypothetical protein BRCON_2304 [Candidatus Sumerlaea chitinivorans]AXA37086.1 hypothetical protein BRCON_2309 [Candidatus Sumerlaea chitinivorans]